MRGEGRVSVLRRLVRVVWRGWEMGAQLDGLVSLKWVIPAWWRKWICLSMMLLLPRGPREGVPNLGCVVQCLCWRVPRALVTMPSLPVSLRAWVRSRMVFLMHLWKRDPVPMPPSLWVLKVV